VLADDHGVPARRPSEKLATVTAVVRMPGRRIRLRARDKLIAQLHRRQAGAWP